MAIADERLKKFFSTQKVGAFDALKIKGKPTSIKAENTQKFAPSNVTTKKSAVDVITPYDSQDSEHEKPQKSTITNIVAKTSAPLPFREHSVSNSLAHQKQIVTTPLAFRETSVSLPLANSLANQDNPAGYPLMSYSRKEREFLNLIFIQCSNNCTLETQPMSTDDLREELKVSPERLRNLIFRISRKGGMHVLKYKTGHNACRIFSLEKNLYQALADQQFKMNNHSVSLANPLATVYSSSININKTTTSLPDDWQKINFSALKHLGFSETQLRQIAETGKSSPEIVQTSIDHFAFGLENNPKVQVYPEPLNVLMGVLRKGGSWLEKNYISPKEKAMADLLAIKQGESVRMRKMEELLIQEEFSIWMNKLQLDERNEIMKTLPANAKLPAGIRRKAEEGALKNYFIENVYKKEDAHSVSIE